MSLTADTPQPSSPRRFRIYGVGIPKTGTTSLAALFGRYNAEHEFMFEETVEQVIGWQSGLVAAGTFRAFLRKRDAAGQLEMDSSSFNHYYLDLVAQEFPDAKFVLTVRDWYGWLNSYLNMLLHKRVTLGTFPAWQIRYGQFQFGEFDPDTFASPQNLRRRLPALLDGFLNCWGESNRRALERLPRERSLILRTHELSSNLDALAHFAGVPTDSLIVKARHSHPAVVKADWLAMLDWDWVQERAARYCADVMAQLFPDFRLELRAPRKPGFLVSNELVLNRLKQRGNENKGGGRGLGCD